jgi:hypothetical protein
LKTVDGVDLRRFLEWKQVAELYHARCKDLPTYPGVYVVLRPRLKRPVFIERSSAGWFKGRNPSYPAEVVKREWVRGARIMYVGMTACKGGLQERIRNLVDFGYGKAVGHRGGRMLWHLPDWEKLEVSWRRCPASGADAMETAMIAAFRQMHRARPFANMKK